MKTRVNHKSFIYKPPNCPLDIIHEDHDILLVNKPSGLLSVPGKAETHKDCQETRLRHVYADILLVHRLDLPTSGLMIFARHKHAQRHLGLQFEKRSIEKTYIARVWGQIQGTTGHINLPLRCDWPDRPKQIVCFEYGKPAQTNWTVLSQENDATRLALYPKTGRSHQLRVHCQQIGHPILGDKFYAHDQALQAAPRLQLHALTLKFRHPNGGKWVEFSAPTPF